MYSLRPRKLVQAKFYENPFLRQTKPTHRACSVASPRAGRLVRRLATWSVASPCAGRLLPLVSPLLFVCTRRSRGKGPLFCKARDLPAPAAALPSLHQLVLLRELLQPHATAPCSSCRCLRSTGFPGAHVPTSRWRTDGGPAAFAPPTSRAAAASGAVPGLRLLPARAVIGEDFVQMNGARARMPLPFIVDELANLQHPGSTENGVLSSAGTTAAEAWQRRPA